MKIIKKQKISLDKKDSDDNFNINDLGEIAYTQNEDLFDVYKLKFDKKT